MGDKMINIIKKHKIVVIVLSILILFSLGLVINLSKSKTLQTITPTITPTYYSVSLTGAVKCPGIYDVKEGEYYFMVINYYSAGLLSSADISQINLIAQVTTNVTINIPFLKVSLNNDIYVKDLSTTQEYVYVYLDTNPIIIYKIPPSMTYQELFWWINVSNNYGVNDTDPIETSQHLIKQNRICINTASAEILSTLPSISESTALKIIEYRKIHNGFTSIEEITEVSGIGDATYEKIKDLISVN